ncbi:hypothetical protein ACHAPO_002501 [Fusarium lateritium]
MGTIQGGPYGPAYYPHGSAHLVGNLQPKPHSQGLLPTIAPKPPSFDYNGHQTAPYGHYTHGQGAVQTPPNPYDFNSPAASQPYDHASGMMPPEPAMAYNRAPQDPRDQYGMLPLNGQYGPPYAIAGQTDPLAPKKGRMDMDRTESDPSIDHEDLDIPEDDASMGESDDDTQDPRQVLEPVMKQFNGTWDTNGTRVRTFSTFAQCNILSDYTASARITELKDPVMLQIFMHFIQVTGPRARILFSEIPLREMSKKFLPVKRFKQAEKDAQNQNQMDSFFPGLSIPSQSELNDHDYDILQTISGQHITAEDYGLGKNQGIDLSNSVTDRDIEHYENVRDLFWWYCKMDVYQSMLAGTRLFMNYEFWSQCPPRAPISKLEAIYGSYDHLMLLLGRLADFSSKDIARKKRASQARGPPPGAPGSSPPPFNGIVPTDGNFQVPRGFTPPKETSPQSDSTEDTDLDESYRIALHEWESIKRGFEAYESKLGPEFQPLKPEFSDKRDSPFGMTMQYRTFSVAGIWMNFYMGMINLVRCHPSMPPAAMQAAGMAAPQTGPYSNKLGRIAAGLSEDVSQATEITTLVSAAFIESCFCLFVAAIEYRDEKQRHWVIRHLRDITRLTGWQSAERIATGCESSWMKAAQLGRGPPYIRAPETEPVPVVRWQAPRQIDRFIQEVETGEIRRQIHVPKAERAQFALGLLSVERDFEALDLKDDD